LETVGEHAVERCAGNDTETTSLCDGPGQSPMRHTHTHATLDDGWQATRVGGSLSE
jgi:hypothetical protein